GVVALRRADGDEDHFRSVHRAGEIGGEEEALGLDVPVEQLLQAGLVDGGLAIAQRLDLGLVHVDAGDEVAGLGETGAGHQSDVTGPHHRDAHLFSLKKSARRYSTPLRGATNPSARATRVRAPARARGSRRPGASATLRRASTARRPPAHSSPPARVPRWHRAAGSPPAARTHGAGSPPRAPRADRAGGARASLSPAALRCDIPS